MPTPDNRPSLEPWAACKTTQEQNQTPLIESHAVHPCPHHQNMITQHKDIQSLEGDGLLVLNVCPAVDSPDRPIQVVHVHVTGHTLTQHTARDGLPIGPTAAIAGSP